MNQEVLFWHTDQGSFKMFPAAYVDSVLYNEYSDEDVRKAAFFSRDYENAYRFKGSYAPDQHFIGLTTAEVYLIKAEAEARLGDFSQAVGDLTVLLTKRYTPGNVPDYNPATAQEAINIILSERKKEMVWRGMRWADLKRLNKHSETAVTIKRELDGREYILPPNDFRYMLLIPGKVVQLAHLEQNPR